MDYKKTNASGTTITRDLMALAEETGNVYETVRIIGKRANEISVDIKHDLERKLQEFSSYTDSLDEIFENREQIEISRYFERLPKATSIATQEFIEGEIYYRNPAKEKDKLEEL
jgi:DNA-directed RNA polymerase subunit K/omega